MSNTEAKIVRSEARDTSGKFVRNPCQCGCGKGAPMVDYYSWEHCNQNGGLGIILRASCAKKLDRMGYEKALEVLKAAAEVAS